MPFLCYHFPGKIKAYFLGLRQVLLVTINPKYK